MRFLRAAAAAAIVMTLAMAFSANAGATTPGSQLDQSSTDSSNFLDGFISQAHGAAASQTFTAGVTGLLTDVDATIWVDLSSESGVLRAAINPTDSGGSPITSTELAVATVPTATLGFFGSSTVDFTFGTPANLVAGTTYAITITEVSSSHQHFFWSGASGDAYAGGTASDTVFGGPDDYAFDTYMIPSETTRVGYCLDGVFENLLEGQPSFDPAYAGAVPATYEQGIGITCDPPPAGWVRNGLAMDFYPYFTAGT